MASSEILLKKGLSPKFITTLNEPRFSNRVQNDLASKYYETRDPSIKELLVKNNIQLVTKIAFFYARKNTEVDVADLIQEGTVGLIKGIEKFNPERKQELYSCIFSWIRAYINNYCRKNNYNFALDSRDDRKLFSNYGRESSKCYALKGFVDDEFIASRLNVSSKSVKNYRSQVSRKVDLASLSIFGGADSEVNDDGLEKWYVHPEDIEGRIDTNDRLTLFKSLINIFLNSIKERDRIIFSRRFLKKDPDPFGEIAKDLGISRQRVQQLEVKILKKFKELVVKNDKLSV